MNFLHPNGSKHARSAVIIIALSLTLAFHFLLADFGYGVGAALFFAALAAGMQAVGAFAGKPNNPWAYVFLLPLLAAAAAEAAYASGAVRLLALPVMIASAAMFGYWLSAPRVAFRQAPVLWPWAMISETAWPFGGYKELLSGFGKSERWPKVALGLVIALPLLIVIGSLFAGADAVFSRAISDAFRLDDLASLRTLIRNLIVAAYLVAAGWIIYTRARDGRGAKAAAAGRPYDATVVATVLISLIVLFAAFLAAQAAALIGGEAFVRSQGISYAEYARSGFFQLLAVAGLVFAALAVIYRGTHLRDPLTRSLSLALIAETGIVIGSAVNRLLLYVDAYGLTVSRYWAMAAIIAIGLVLLAMAAAALAKVDYAPLAKGVFLAALIVLPLFLLFNAEGFVVRYNAGRFLSGQTAYLDLPYLERLSSDALPALAELAGANWPAEEVSSGPIYDPCSALTSADRRCSREGLRSFLGERRGLITERIRGDWRQSVMMDYLAAASLSGF